jgi:hypothetical protein
MAPYVTGTAGNQDTLRHENSNIPKKKKKRERERICMLIIYIKGGS